MEPGRPRAARNALIAYAVIFVASLVLHIAFERGEFPQRLIASAPLAIAMPTLWIFVRAVAPRNRTTWFLTLVLFFSWIGDLTPFEIKLVSFLIAHVFYCVIFWPYAKAVLRRWPLAVSYASGIGAALAVVVLHAGTMRLAVIMYGIVLGLMAILSFGLSVRAGVGGLLFVISDLALGINRFVTDQITYPGALNSLFYLPAQALLTTAVVRAVGAASKPSG